jgi:hypothetical protein
MVQRTTSDEFIVTSSQEDAQAGYDIKHNRHLLQITTCLLVYRSSYGRNINTHAVPAEARMLQELLVHCIGRLILYWVQKDLNSIILHLLFPFFPFFSSFITSSAKVASPIVSANSNGVWPKLFFFLKA